MAFDIGVHMPASLHTPVLPAFSEGKPHAE